MRGAAFREVCYVVNSVFPEPGFCFWLIKVSPSSRFAFLALLVGIACRYYLFQIPFLV